MEVNLGTSSLMSNFDYINLQATDKSHFTVRYGANELSYSKSNILKRTQIQFSKDGEENAIKISQRNIINC